MGPGPDLGPQYISLKPDKARAQKPAKPAGFILSPYRPAAYDIAEIS